METIMTIGKSLEAQSECPLCGISWEAVDEMLRDGMQSDNYRVAQIIIGNCHVCRERFQVER